MADSQYCAKCGTSRPADAGFCVNCGEKFVDSAPVERIESVANEKVVVGGAKSSRKLSALAIVLLLVGLIVGYGGGYASLEPVVDQLGSENRDLEQANQDLELKNLVLDGDTADLRKEVNDLKVEQDNAKGSIAKLTEENEQVRADYEAATATIEKSEEENARFIVDLEKSQSQVLGLSEQLDSLKTKLGLINANTPKIEKARAAIDCLTGAADCDVDQERSAIEALDPSLVPLLNEALSALAEAQDWLLQQPTDQYTDEWVDWVREFLLRTANVFVATVEYQNGVIKVIGNIIADVEESL